jgi:hypothetical protein
MTRFVVGDDRSQSTLGAGHLWTRPFCSDSLMCLNDA